MNKSVLEKIALTASLAIVITGLWFWYGELQSVLELLEMAG